MFSSSLYRVFVCCLTLVYEIETRGVTKLQSCNCNSTNNKRLLCYALSVYSRFVCMGGTPHRMQSFAEYMVKELGYILPTGTDLVDISARSHRL